MFNFLIIWLIFIIIIHPKFNDGMNDQNSSKGRPWLDLNLLPHELPEPPDESLNPNPANLTEQPNDPPNLRREPLNKNTNSNPYELLELESDESEEFDEVEPRYLKIPRVDVKGNELSQVDLEVKFVETIGQRWTHLRKKNKNKEFCYHLWILMSGPDSASCNGRVIKQNTKKSSIKFSTQNLRKVKVDTFCCICFVPSSTEHTPGESFLVTKYSKNDYFILKRPTRGSWPRIVGFLPDVKVDL